MKAINLRTLSQTAQDYVSSNTATGGYFGVDHRPEGGHAVHVFPTGKNPASPPPPSDVSAELLRAALVEDAGQARVYEFAAGASRPSEPDRAAFDRTVDGERKYSAAMRLYQRAAGYKASPAQNRVSRKAFDTMSHEERMAVALNGTKIYDEAAQ